MIDRMEPSQSDSQKGDGVFTTLKSTAKLVLLALKKTGEADHAQPVKR